MMSNIELILCPKCKEYYDANHDDLGSYFCPRCPTKPRLHDYEQLEKFVAALFIKHTNRINKDKHQNENKH
jgi:Zn-finger nucleic acid-binding protein